MEQRIGVPDVNLLGNLVPREKEEMGIAWGVSNKELKRRMKDEVGGLMAVQDPDWPGSDGELPHEEEVQAKWEGLFHGEVLDPQHGPCAREPRGQDPEEEMTGPRHVEATQSTTLLVILLLKIWKS